MFQWLGFHSLRNYERFILYAKNMVCTGKNIRGLKHCGSNPYIQFPAIFAGKENISIGENFTCFSRCRIEAFKSYKGQEFTPYIEIGNHVSINFNFHLGCINHIKIGNGVLIGSDVLITDHNHGNGTFFEKDINPADRILVSKGKVIIEDKVWIGEKATILSGVRIGEGAIIAANSVVVSDIPQYCVAAGVPAKVVKYMRSLHENEK